MDEYVEKHIVVDDAVIKDWGFRGVIDAVWWSVSIYDGETVYYRDLIPFSMEQRYVFAIHWYDIEVCNGGHKQFYWNSTGIVWQETLNGFKEMGLKELYDLMQESVNRMGGNPSRMRLERQEQLSRVVDGFDDLDDRYYDLKYGPNDDDIIENALDSYVRENRERFYFDGVIMIPKQ